MTTPALAAVTPPQESHPHDSRRPIPERLPADELRALSVLQPWRALGAVAAEWLAIAAAIALCQRFWHPLLYVPVVMFIAARQHALQIIGHDATHHRFLPSRFWNELLGNLLLMWPLFISVQGFRLFHGPHHQHTGTESDANRQLWRTHDAAGNLMPEWVYPKTPAGLARVLLRRGFLLTGLRWILRGVLAPLRVKERPWLLVLRLAFMAGAAALLTWTQAWRGFLIYWVVPYCTWHIAIQYARLICEHSAIHSSAEDYRLTRTTIPTLLESLFILPRNVGYHLEHHWYPSVPFYRLPELHARLLQEPSFRAHANIHRSVRAALAECVRPQA